MSAISIAHPGGGRNKINLINIRYADGGGPLGAKHELWQWGGNADHGIALHPEMRIIRNDVTANGHRRLEAPHRTG